MKLTKRHLRITLITLAIICAASFLLRAQLKQCALSFYRSLKGKKPVISLYQTLKGRRTIAERVVQYGPEVHQRMGADFAKAGVAYPPHKVTLVGIKFQRIIQIWAAGVDEHWRHIKDYPVLGMSGVLGPKLAEDDGQVPEGIYRVESLNPISISHLSLRVGYPNADDVKHAKLDGRTNLGGGIMIHGGKSSGGCLAVGNPGSEDFFVLAAETGIENVSIIITPVDLRTQPVPAEIVGLHTWSAELYASIKEALDRLEVSEPVKVP